MMDKPWLSYKYVAPQKKKRSFSINGTAVLVVSAVLLGVFDVIAVFNSHYLPKWTEPVAVLISCSVYGMLFSKILTANDNSEKDKIERIVNQAYVDADKFVKSLGLCDASLPSDLASDVNSDSIAISDLIMFLLLAGRKDDVNNVFDNYGELKAIVEGIEQAYNINDMRTSQIQYLRQEYIKRIRQLENDLYQLVKPQMQNIMFTLMKGKHYEWLPDETKQKLVRDYNDRLVHDLKQNEV